MWDWSGREDLNLRLHRPERCALPGCATPRPRRPESSIGSPTLPPMPRLDSNERLIIGLTLAIKVGVLLLGLIAWQVVHGTQVDFPGLSLWDRWDAPHYTDLMVYGYRADDPGNLTNRYGYQQVYPGDLGLYIVFYPLFPWLGGALNALIHAPVLSAFIVAGIASVV